ncbi:hypothetical protein SCUCBS95973_005558 [Sporothrix curviconia]|uniref:Major facilitator superfamily (MFS) profile domain-containing protein n=1 Tax=Sporothrix curviconia TaxID=1260050 RepID=A0ABP0BY82_9PEZI
MFLVSYIVFQLPGTLFIRNIGAPWQFFGAMILWGLFTAVSVAIHTSAALLAMRFMIGVAEAFVQGTVFYLSFFYTYSEITTRGAIFFSTFTIAGAFKGLIVEYKLQWLRVPLVLLSPHFWTQAVISCAGHFCVSSLSNFLPSIIASFGYSSLNAQLFSVIVYVYAAVGVIFWARASDTTNARSATLGASIVVSIVGYAILIGVDKHKVQFFATCLVAFSAYPNINLQLSWATLSFSGYTRRGASLALFNIISQAVSIAANQAYDDPPYYHKGQAASLGMCYANKKKREMPEDVKAALQVKGIEELGDEHPDYFYTI